MKILQLLVALLATLGTLAQSPYGVYADLLLSLSDQALYDAAVQRRVGQCFIVLCSTSNCACDLYAKVSINSTTSAGLPDLYGTGCVVAPDFPKGMNICFPNPNTYAAYNSTPTPICTKSGVKNAANMIRIAIQRGYCKLPICLAFPNCPVLVPK
jgi:hypothetical protein